MAPAERLLRDRPTTSTLLLDLSRDAPDVAKRIVTVSPDVSSSTNLAGWLNKVGVWSTDERHNWFETTGKRSCIGGRIPSADTWNSVSPRRTSSVGGYVLGGTDKPDVTLVTMGALVTETLSAADRLDQLRVAAEVVSVTGPGLLYEALQARHGLGDGPS